MVRAVFAIIGLATFYGLHRRAGVMGLILLSLPVVASMQFYLGYPMRLIAAEGAVKLLELGSVSVVRVGTQIEIAGHVIGVDPACGGVRMLWHALAAAMGLAAIHCLRWRATICGALLAVMLVIPANTLRAAMLVVFEIGYFPNNFISHGSVGLLSFAVILLPLWWTISSKAKCAESPQPSINLGRTEVILSMMAAFLVPIMFLISPLQPTTTVGHEAEWFTFQGLTLPLQPLPLTETELAFAKRFPGTLSSHRWGSDQVILRRVNQATRRLHASHDCLRAAGFETTDAVTVRLSDGGVWSLFYAVRDEERWTVHERITTQQNDAVWTDVSAWYWAAWRHPLNGPWQAETVISR